MAKKKSSKARPPVKKATPAAVTAATIENMVVEMSPPTATPEAMPVVETPSVVAEMKPAPAVEKERRRISVGIWAYFLGLIIAFAAVLMFTDPGNQGYVYLALGILGFLVGLLNINDEEVMLFLVASIAFVVSADSVRQVIDPAASSVAQFLSNVIIFAAASAFIVSIKALIRVAKNK